MKIVPSSDGLLVAARGHRPAAPARRSSVAGLPARGTLRVCVGLLILGWVCFGPQPAQAQITDEPQDVRRLLATPIGALPPTAMPMPASRNHNYWGVRLQLGHVRGVSEPDRLAIAGGLDLQWRGGSVFGLTGGYQTSSCDRVDPDCGAHALFGARARFNVITGGPTFAALIGDYSATTTLGTEVGFGYAPDALRAAHVCTVDLGVPISLAMLQSVRIVSFFSPGLVWEVGCTADRATRASYFTGFGVAVQQIGGRALDVHIGAQKIFRSAAGFQIGLNVTYVRLP